MRVIYFGNNSVGLRVLKSLVSQGDEVVALVVHPARKGRYRDEMIDAAHLPGERVFDGSKLRDPSTAKALLAVRPDIGLSVFFGYILRQDVISLFPSGCLNLHPSYLPFNRGAYPNVWSIVEGTPAGVTLHYIDAGVDTGDIVARRQVEVLPTDTGQSLYTRLEDACETLFEETWPLVRAGSADRSPQAHGHGTHHRAADVNTIDHVELDRTYTARDLINLIRARTFPPYKGAYFEDQGRRVYLRLELLREDEVSRPARREGSPDDH